MNFLKRFFQLIFEPIKLTGNRDFSEKLAKFFTHNTFVIYIIAGIITSIVFLICYLG